MLLRAAGKNNPPPGSSGQGVRNSPPGSAFESVPNKQSAGRSRALSFKEDARLPSWKYLFLGSDGRERRRPPIPCDAVWY